jgi:hypothetical protein
MTTPPEERAHKTLLLLLSPTFPGEVIAVRDALLRLFALDPYQLTTDLLRSASPDQKTESKPHQDRHGTYRWQHNRRSEHVEMAEAILRFAEGGGRLTSVERSFVGDMVEWNAPSEKQTAWLNRIHARAMGAS